VVRRHGEVSFSQRDFDFDVRISVEGPEATSLALLDADARAALREFVSPHTGQIERGEVIIETTDVVAELEELVSLVDRALTIAHHLSIPRDAVPERLANIALTDPNRKCRVRAFAVLLEKFGDTDEANSAIRAVLASAGDHPPKNQLLAAMRLGDEGLEHLRRLSRFRDPELAPGACEALARRGDESAHARLVEMLGDGALEMRRAAVEALGQAGTVAAVEPLLDCAASAPLIGGAELRKEAKVAVAKIQSRLGGVDPGRVSLVESGMEGALSVAADSGGLAIVEPEE